ncbi:hypothetical protein A2U01_0034646 [Trifolium medium]|uniref:Uncharacterized protein n=1 Tax=Trifolium medium TaxID=97028 RepID=A0A392PN74_9FABA|nr:hypothetical protein [Trifolium medium]
MCCFSRLLLPTFYEIYCDVKISHVNSVVDHVLGGRLLPFKSLLSGDHVLRSWDHGCRGRHARAPCQRWGLAFGSRPLM